MTRAACAVLLLALAGAGWAQDPNVKAPDGYTPLARALFDRREAAGKLDKVRALLDQGANPNLDHGGWGRWGALGLALREEPAVVALLVERGATLKDPSSAKGPLTLAVQMERDDLAAALLRRDRRVAAHDSEALPLAARRGWRELVQALLAARADANAADDRGLTALAYAQRRHDKAMAQALVVAGAKQVAAARPASPAAPGFAGAAAREIDDTVFFDPPRFALGPGPESGFAFYGLAMNELEEVRCERSAAFGIVAMANMAGGINVGVCTREARRVRGLALAAKGSLDGLLGLLSQSGPKLDAAALEKAGWVYRQRATPAGEVFSFPVLMVGHGILGPDTLVLLPKDGKRAVVVQADTRRLCENYGLQSQTPLCSDRDGTLLEIARRIAAVP